MENLESVTLIRGALLHVARRNARLMFKPTRLGRAKNEKGNPMASTKKKPKIQGAFMLFAKGNREKISKGRHTTPKSGDDRKEAAKEAIEYGKKKKKKEKAKK